MWVGEVEVGDSGEVGGVVTAGEGGGGESGGGGA